MKKLKEIKDEVSIEFNEEIHQLVYSSTQVDTIAKRYAEEALKEATKAIDNTSIELFKSEYEELEKSILNIINELK